jgi:hypothetical protein
MGWVEGTKNLQSVIGRKLKGSHHAHARQNGKDAPPATIRRSTVIAIGKNLIVSRREIRVPMGRSRSQRRRRVPERALWKASFVSHWRKYCFCCFCASVDPPSSSGFVRRRRVCQSYAHCARPVCKRSCGRQRQCNRPRARAISGGDLLYWPTARDFTKMAAKTFGYDGRGGLANRCVRLRAMEAPS